MNGNAKQMSVPDTKVGQTSGALGTYAKAPPMDKNHVAAQKGVGDKSQYGFNKAQGA